MTKIKNLHGEFELVGQVMYDLDLLEFETGHTYPHSKAVFIKVKDDRLLFKKDDGGPLNISKEELVHVQETKI